MNTPLHWTRSVTSSLRTILNRQTSLHQSPASSNSSASSSHSSTSHLDEQSSDDISDNLDVAISNLFDESSFNLNFSNTDINSERDIDEEPAVPHPYSFETDLFTSTMNSNLPPFFKGSRSDHPEKWLQHMNLFLDTQRGLSERNKVSFAALRLCDGALAWFHTLTFLDPDNSINSRDLPENTIRCYEDFCQAFSRKFRDVTPSERLWEISGLWEQKQGSTPTEEYVNTMRELGSKAHASSENIRLAVIAGLRDEVKSMVLTKEIESLDDIVRWGCLAERIHAPKNHVEQKTGQDQRGTLAAVVEAVQDLRNQMSSMKVQVLSANGIAPSAAPTMDQQASFYGTAPPYTQATQGPSHGFPRSRGPGRGYPTTRGRREQQTYPTANPGSTRFDNVNNVELYSCRACNRVHAEGECLTLTHPCNRCSALGHWSFACPWPSWSAPPGRGQGPQQN